jgi:hypothetical protein
MLLIADHSNLGLCSEVEYRWAVLNTFDMLSPRYDLPRTVSEVRCWFEESGLIDCHVGIGDNGIVGTGQAPAEPCLPSFDLSQPQ